MNSDIQKMRNEVEKREREFTAAKKRLDDIVNSCQHKFGETIPDHIVYPGYYSPGDPPGTMGVDRQLPCYVSESVKKRWKRICDICGKIEYTQSVRKETQIKEFPEWPGERRSSRDNYFPEEGGYSKLDQ
jgi:hypothetical protein